MDDVGVHADARPESPRRDRLSSCQGDKDVTVLVTPTEFKDESEDEDESEDQSEDEERNGPPTGNDDHEDEEETGGAAANGTVDDRAEGDDGGGSEITCVEIEIQDNDGACKCADDGLYLPGAEVKGGPETATYDCGDVANSNQEYSRIPDACAPVNDRNGKRYGISNIVIEVCVFPNCYDPGTTSCAKGCGG